MHHQQGKSAQGADLHRELLAWLASHQLALGIVGLEQVRGTYTRRELHEAIHLILQLRIMLSAVSIVCDSLHCRPQTDAEHVCAP